MAFEIIVVDNGSDNSPRSVCAEFEDVVLLTEVTRGPGHARNRGARAARGEIVSFIDADCVVAPGFVAALAHFFANRRDADFVGGPIRIACRDPDRPRAHEAFEILYSYRNRLYVEKHGYAATSNMAARLAVFRAVGGFGGIDMMEDVEWGRRALSLGFRGAYAPDVAVTTPACADYAGLVRRWDRHVAHEYVEWRRGNSGVVTWLFRALLIAMSPVAEIPNIAVSADIATWHARMGAFAVLVRLRFHRCVRMLSLLMLDDTASTFAVWNRAPKRPPCHHSGKAGASGE